MDTNKDYDFEALGIDTQNAHKIQGVNAFRTFCPKCHADRKPEHLNERELFVSLDGGFCYCHNCGKSFPLRTKDYTRRKDEAEALARKHSFFKRPVPNAAAIDVDHMHKKTLEYLTKTRGLTTDVLREMNITLQREIMPQTKKEEFCFVFDYREQGFLINQKFRDEKKNFKMVQGAELIPYNVDACLGMKYVIITEGEFDALSFKVAGLDSVISMPSGANGNTSWLNRFWDVYFDDKERIFIATDMDAPGIKAAEELIRRFGPERCSRIVFSNECKDANDELVKMGAESLRQCFINAEPVPLKDICSMNDIEESLDAVYQDGPEPGKTTGWANLDSVVQFETGQLALVTGRSNDGKSEWLDELVIRLMLRTGWNAGYWTPENTLIDHARKVIEKLTDKHFEYDGKTGVRPAEFQLCKQWMKERISWVELPFDQLHLTTILERCRTMVRKFGIRILVLDPFNFIEKENDNIRSENAWDSHVVGAVRNFAIEHKVLVFLVAHPRKVEMQIDGRKRRITIEDISGTADFGNKADYCFCIDRDDEHKIVTVSIDKVRRKQYGSKGKQVFYVYNANSGRYCPCERAENKEPVNTDFRTSSGMWLQLPGLFPGL